MKLGASTFMFGDRPLGDCLAFFADLGLETVELGTGGYVGNDHCDPQDLLADGAKLKVLRETLSEFGMTISALSCHGNPLHPDDAIAKRHQEEFRSSVRLAHELDVKQVVTFSGCPGSDEYARTPSFVSVFWPEDFSHVVEWQWTDRLIPYWTREAEYCAELGVNIAIEPHPGFCVYNASSLLRLRDAAGKAICANLDPSHMFWQGVEIPEAIRTLGDVIVHVHAKDTSMNGHVVRSHGVLDTRTYGDEANRAWIFRTPGYGHGVEVWRDIVSALRLVGYDSVLSFEYEDTFIAPEEACVKAIGLLKDAVIAGSQGRVWTWRYSDQTR